MKRRIISSVLSIVLIMSCLSVLALNASAASALTLSSDKSKASIGELVKVSVSIPSGLSGITLSVGFDSDYFLAVNAKSGGLFGNSSVAVHSDGVGYAAAMDGKTAKAGVALIVTLKVLKRGGTINAKLLEAYDINDNPVSVSPASLTIKPGEDIIKFSDVPKGIWYYNAVEYCAERGWIVGYNNGSFGAADNLQRQDFVLILARVGGVNLSKYNGQNGSFKDVPTNAYYSAAVAWGKQAGIIAGYNKDKFGVQDPITREQVATILYQYVGAPVIENVDETLARFPDSKKISAYARIPLAWAVQNEVIGGMDDGTLNPLGNAARAQIAQIIMKMDKAGLFNS